MNAAASLSAAKSDLRERARRGQITWGWTLALLFSRTLLFALFQALIALVFSAQGADHPWQASIAWWPITATLTNLTVLALLAWRGRQEGTPLSDLYRIHRGTVGRDLLTLLGFSLILGPAGFLPNILLANLLFGSAEVANNMFFLPLPLWAVLFSFLFPITIGLTELPAYFGYVMPRLEALTGRRWLAWVIAASFLSIQHATLPLIFDTRFLIWRLFMFLPFALLTGLLLSWRPRLFPYMLIVHGLMDLSLIIFLLPLAY